MEKVTENEKRDFYEKKIKKLLGTDTLKEFPDKISSNYSKITVADNKWRKN